MSTSEDRVKMNDEVRIRGNLIKLIIEKKLSSLDNLCLYIYDHYSEEGMADIEKYFVEHTEWVTTFISARFPKFTPQPADPMPAPVQKKEEKRMAKYSDTVFHLRQGNVTASIRLPETTKWKGNPILILKGSGIAGNIDSRNKDIEIRRADLVRSGAIKDYVFQCDVECLNLNEAEAIIWGYVPKQSYYLWKDKGGGMLKQYIYLHLDKTLMKAAKDEVPSATKKSDEPVAGQLVPNSYEKQREDAGAATIGDIYRDNRGMIWEKALLNRKIALTTNATFNRTYIADYSLSRNYPSSAQKTYAALRLVRMLDTTEPGCIVLANTILHHPEMGGTSGRYRKELEKNGYVSGGVVIKDVFCTSLIEATKFVFGHRSTVEALRPSELQHIWAHGGVSIYNEVKRLEKNANRAPIKKSMRIMTVGDYLALATPKSSAAAQAKPVLDPVGKETPAVETEKAPVKVEQEVNFNMPPRGNLVEDRELFGKSRDYTLSFANRTGKLRISLTKDTTCYTVTLIAGCELLPLMAQKGCVADLRAKFEKDGAIKDGKVVQDINCSSFDMAHDICFGYSDSYPKSLREREEKLWLNDDGASCVDDIEGKKAIVGKNNIFLLASVDSARLRVDSAKEYVVMKGSELLMNVVETKLNEVVFLARRKLIATGVVSKNGVFVKDWPCQSPAFAASVITGRIGCHDDMWKNCMNIALPSYLSKMFAI